MELNKVKEELKAAALATLFFLCCFLFIVALKKLFLAQYDIGFYGLTAAVISAGLVGKVVVVLDKTSAGNRFEATRAPLLSVLYKTSIYSAVVLAVVAAEKVFHAYWQSRDLSAAVGEVWHGRDRNTILATVLCVGAAFAAYNLLAAINRGPARGRLGAWLLGRGSDE